MQLRALAHSAVVALSKQVGVVKRDGCCQPCYIQRTFKGAVFLCQKLQCSYYLHHPQPCSCSQRTL